MKLIHLGLVVAIGVFVLSCMYGCSGQKKISNGQKTYVLIPKCESISFMHLMYKGFEETCNALGVTPLYRGPDVAVAEKQIEIINQVKAQGVTGIAVDADDFDALQPALMAVAEAGIKVISIDSAVNAKSRLTHIQQVSAEAVGRKLIQAAHEMVGGNGGIAILSASAQMNVQNEWIGWMKRELADHRQKYAGTPLVKIAYGDDDPTKSTAEALALLKDPSIKVIISPTTVGMLAAGKVIQDKQSDVKLTGLGLPSEMSSFIRSGVCPWMYLWNPIDQGRIAAYVLHALDNGSITGKSGDIFQGGDLGELKVTPAHDGGTEVIMGEPLRFDRSNIDKWEAMF